MPGVNRAIDFVRPLARTLAGKPAPVRADGPASATPLPDEAAMVFGPLGVQAVHASVVDVESMACEQRWHITSDGVRRAEPAEAVALATEGFSSAMATIVHLNRDGANTTLARRIDPHRWAFAWRVDERHVAVAEAQYREVCDDATGGDGALVRQICDSGIRFGRVNAAAEAVNDRNRPLLPPALAWMLRWPLVTAWLLRWRTHDAAGARPPLSGLARAGVVRGRAMLWLAGMALATAALAGGIAVLRAPTGPAAPEPSLADATMTRLLGTTLAGGDYGEVQGVLDSFEALRYFQGAVVTNGQGRVVAKAGQTPRLRIGDPLPAAMQGSGRQFALHAPGALSTGQLTVWGAPEPARDARGSWPLTAALAACGVLGAGALASLHRERRRHRAALAR